MFRSEQNDKKKRLTVSIPLIIIYIVGIASAVIYRVSLTNHAVADFFRDTIGFALRFVLTRATYFLPFSFGEILLFISIPLAVFLLVRFIMAVKRSSHRWREVLRGIARFGAVLCVIMFLFTFTLGVGYGATPIHTAMGIQRRLISPDDLAYAMRILVDEVNAELEMLEADNMLQICAETGGTIMPYDLRELSRLVHQAFEHLSDEREFVRLIRARAKPIIISEVFSRMTIVGVYSFFTGEANINIMPPDYTTPHTVAHEFAHVFGIAREDEANFAAFLATLYADCSYIRYSGLLRMIERLRSPLRDTNPEVYVEIIANLSSVARADMMAGRNFWAPYRDQPVARAASAVNDAYLRAQGRGRDEDERHLGVATYGLDRDLAVIYLREFYGR